MFQSSVFLRIAPAIFILVWSCGFIVAKYVIPYAPPLTFLSFRYVGVFILMSLLTVWARVAFPRGALLWHTFVVGVLMYAGYLGGCWMGVALGMPAGVMALVTNLQPVLTALLTTFALSHTNERITNRQWWGLLLGLGGVALVLSTKLGAVSQATFGLSAVVLSFGALASITVATLYQKHFCSGVDPRASQAMQALAAFIVTVPFAVSIETQPIIWSTHFWGALVFSVCVLSGIGTSLLLWLIDRGAATQVTAYLYWVPPVSSLIAWIMFDERIVPVAWPGFALVALGVYCVVSTTKSPVIGKK